MKLGGLNLVIRNPLFKTPKAFDTDLFMTKAKPNDPLEFITVPKFANSPGNDPCLQLS